MSAIENSAVGSSGIVVPSPGGAPAAKPTPKSARFILTATCPDATGVVAAVAGFLARQHASIIEAHHFDDAETDTSFMRFVFRDDGRGLQSLIELNHAFARDVAQPLRMQFQLREVQRKCRTLLAVSQHGHCLNNLLHRWSAGTLPIDVAAVVSNHEKMRGLVEWHGVPFYYFPVLDGQKPEQERQIMGLFEELNAELLVLARYMQILTANACEYFSGRAINIHHSFLPGFKGAKAYHQAHARGVKLIGATAHYVTTDLDEGPIIEQEVQRVDHALAPDDLVDIGRDLESLVLTRAVKWHAEQRVFRNGHRTVVLK